MQVRGVMAMVSVQDIDLCVRFYRDTLGLTVEEEAEEWVLFQEGIGLRVSPEPLPDLRHGINTVMVALAVDDLAAAYRELTARAVPFYLPPTQTSGATFAVLRDPEGNLIQLTQL